MKLARNMDESKRQETVFQHVSVGFFVCHLPRNYASQNAFEEAAELTSEL